MIELSGLGVPQEEKDILKCSIHALLAYFQNYEKSDEERPEERFNIQLINECDKAIYILHNEKAVWRRSHKELYLRSPLTYFRAFLRGRALKRHQIAQNMQ